MFENTTMGEWAVLALSLIFGLISGSKFAIVFILSLIALFVIYYVMNKAYPASTNWGMIPWIVVLLVISLTILFIIGVGMGFMSTGSHDSDYQWVNYSNYGISFNHPSVIPLNTSADEYPSISYYNGHLQFDNPDKQEIWVIWSPKGDRGSPEAMQEMFTLTSQHLIKAAPDGRFSQIQTFTQSGNTIYYSTFEGNDLTENGRLGYLEMAQWVDSPSQRYFFMFAGSYKSKEDAHVLFEGVLNSFEGH
ncbi:MAG: hypothetical protein LUQ31_01235 [Methanoregula sp.]|nr:hypothetical protein [Methanoregula sp.]